MTLTGTTLQKALNATEGQIALRRGKEYLRDVTADEIPLMIADGRYQFVGRASKVRYVRQLDPSAIIVLPWKAHFEPCWLNRDAAVIRFHGEAA